MKAILSIIVLLMLGCANTTTTTTTEKAWNYVGNTGTEAKTWEQRHDELMDKAWGGKSRELYSDEEKRMMAKSEAAKKNPPSKPGDPIDVDAEMAFAATAGKIKKPGGRYLEFDRDGDVTCGGAPWFDRNVCEFFGFMRIPPDDIILNRLSYEKDNYKTVSSTFWYDRRTKKVIAYRFEFNYPNEEIATLHFKEIMEEMVKKYGKPKTDVSSKTYDVWIATRNGIVGGPVTLSRLDATWEHPKIVTIMSLKRDTIILAESNTKKP